MENIPILISSGLYIPIILTIIGICICLTSRLLIKDRQNYEKIDKKVIILCGAIGLSLCLFFIDWKLALYIIAIVLGKYIWIDFVFDFRGLVEQYKSYRSQYSYFGSNSISIGINIFSQFAYSFAICTIALKIIKDFPLWVQIVGMVLLYIIMFGWVIVFHKERVAKFDYETKEKVEKRMGTNNKKL